MTTKENIGKYIEQEKRMRAADRPIFEILMIEYAGKGLIGKTGKPLGWPDTGATAEMGFFYNLDDAVEAVENNYCDIRETIYDAAFILCHFPGLYYSAGTEGRMYFEWDGRRYVQKEEPGVFRNISL